MAIITKIKEQGSQGKKPEERTVEQLLNAGIIVLNKPAGPTSHQVAEYVKNILKIKKAGHGGTLDPAVSGVLVIMLNNATRIGNTMLTAGKEYICLMHLHKDNVTDEELQKAIKKFTGKIRQKPPVRSAVKRQERTREVYYADILERQGKDVLLKIGCQAGTYMRKWCDQVGELLGGAHMAQLHRSKAGPFTDKEYVTLQDVADAKEEDKLKEIIKPIEAATTHMKKIWVTDSTVNPLCHGANLNVPGIAKYDDNIKALDQVAIFTLKNELICIGQAKMTSNQIKKASKGKAIRTSKVFLEPNYFS